ncbi:MAG: GTPase [Planctomycetota bacterium]
MKLLTTPGVAGVAVVEAEPAERPAVLACLRSVGGGPCAPALGGPARRATLVIDGRDVDDVLVVARPSGAREVHVHGAAAVLDQLDAAFGLRVEGPRSPAERLLRDALSPEQFDLAAEQLSYDFDAELASLRRLSPARRRAARDEALRRSAAALALAAPQRVALVGQQNAGKSTLFNRLLFRERSLTGATPGLTRDPVSERTTLAGYPYELVDTAGEGAASSPLDAAAITRGRAEREKALAVVVVDGARGPITADVALAAASALVVRSKADLTPGPWPATLRCDASFSSEREQPPALRERFGALLAAARGLPDAGAVGGFAALDAQQQRALAALDVDGPAAAPGA